MLSQDAPMTVTEETAPRGRRERKKDVTRRAIRKSAVELFIRQGFTETSVEQIADAAQVAPRTFFRYFRTKEATLFSLESFDMILTDYRSAPPEVDPLTALVTALERSAGRELLPETATRRDLRRSLLSVPAVSRYVSEMADYASIRIRSDTKYRLGVPEECFDYRAEVMAGLIRSVTHSHVYQTGAGLEHADKWRAGVVDLADLARGHAASASA